MILKEILVARKQNSMPTTVCFIDFKKAYDRVKHAALFYQLSKHGING